MSEAKALQEKLEAEVNELRTMQKDIGKSHEVHRQFTMQQSENELVLKELEQLDGDANVFKLIGPVLVKQDLVEAKANVSKRLEYITSEIKRLEETLKSLEKKHEAKRDDILKVQQRLQSQMQAGQSRRK